MESLIAFLLSIVVSLSYSLLENGLCNAEIMGSCSAFGHPTN
jgi:hypothetical protein